jgi:hypothetical protein
MLHLARPSRDRCGRRASWPSSRRGARRHRIFMRLASIIFSAALLVGCSSPGTRPHMFSNEWRENPKKYGDSFDWNNGSPVEFLELLKQSGDTYSVLGFHHGWIRASDIEPLMRRLDAQTPCAFVVSTACSQLPRGRSTEGREAAFLLEGYRCHYYPPMLSSGDFAPDPAALRRWYRVWNTRK